MELTYRKNPDFPHRYISPADLEKFLQENLSDFISQIGTSHLGKPIYKLSLGSGSVRVLAWSQMHGNESNSTLSMLDLLYSLDFQKNFRDSLFSKISLDFIFMLNPDGSEVWKRRNALDIDLNRDYRQLASKEFPLLKEIAETGKYDYALNLHEQRTVFSTDGANPATLSFLAPSENVEREVTDNRKKAMAVISRIYDALIAEMPNQISLYSDEFYPTSTGDNFMKKGLPTVLFEGGHYPDDYLREGTRKFYTYALYEGLKAISELDGKADGWEKYLEIPKNQESHYDIIYRNVKLNTDFECILDVAVQFREEKKENCEEITFVPIVVEVGDVGNKKGWKEIDCTGKYFKSESKYPKLDAEVNFEII